MLINIRYPNYASVLISFVFCTFAHELSMSLRYLDNKWTNYVKHVFHDAMYGTI